MTRLQVLSAVLLVLVQSGTQAQSAAQSRQIVEYALTQNGVAYKVGFMDVTIDPYFPLSRQLDEDGAAIGASSERCPGGPLMSKEVTSGRSVSIARVNGDGVGVAIRVWARDTRFGDTLRAEVNGCVTEGPRVIGPVLAETSVQLTDTDDVILKMSDPSYALRLHLRSGAR